ncbi:MAG: sigma-70 family RNA polymerase sigma factor [Rhodanobacteraceae bacterium]|nr:sigma-70 family RNA polymerase sigma factor [Rhodanobacteraceae bacterium]
MRVPGDRRPGPRQRPATGGRRPGATIRPWPASGIDVTAASFQIEIPDTVLARARRGELGALEQIYRAFERPAYTLALRLLGNPDHAREAVHDAMLRLLERIGQFRGDAPFWGWLRQIVVNEALMRLRRERGIAFEELPEDDDTPGHGPPPWALADARQLERALERLPALTRSVLWLYHVEEYTHAEIAALTGKSVSFSKSQVARGSQRLRALLEANEEVAPCLIATTA